MAANLPSVSQEDVNANKGMAILSYLGFLCLIPIFAKKDSPYCRFHANQGLLLFILELACSILSVVPMIGFIFGLVSIVCLIFAIMGIVNAAGGKVQPLPLIGGITILK